MGTEEENPQVLKAYSGQYLETYEGHHMAVYSQVESIPSSRLRVLCRLDRQTVGPSGPPPVMSFDLFNAVGDVAWAPYSSTVFAAVTSDGKVHVFDLNENNTNPL